MYRKPGLKGVSTALATIAIILVLILGMSWMAYMVVLNARQQAEMAGRAETVALKAKELIRVYVWLDPARQPDGRYLNLARISFVGEWSGETVINGLLIAYTDGRTEVRNVNIRLGAGEDKTYLPSELGLTGLDNYDAFKARVKYIQAHTSLGNDFVNVWGRPDKPALYVTGTTRTDTYTTTRTETSRIPTTTTTSVTGTSYTTTVTITTTVYADPYGMITCSASWEHAEVTVQFSAGSWGSPPYRITLTIFQSNYGGMEVWSSTGEWIISGTSWSYVNYEIYRVHDSYSVGISLVVVSVDGRGAKWRGGCEFKNPPPDMTSSTSLTTSTGPPTTTTGPPTTITSTPPDAVPTVTATVTKITYVSTDCTTSTVSTWYVTTLTITSTIYATITVDTTVTATFTRTSTMMVTKHIDSYAIIPSGGYDNIRTCGMTPSITNAYTATTTPAETGGLNSPVFLSAILALLSYDFIGKHRLARKILKYLFSIGGLSAVIVILALTAPPGGVLAETYTTTVTTTVTVTACASYTTVTASTTWVMVTYVTSYTTTTFTFTHRITVTETVTSTTGEFRCQQSCWNLCVLLCCACEV